MNRSCLHLLIDVFNVRMGAAFDTELVGGGVEPIYRPRDKQHEKHRIIFTQDYFSSALHEIAHWCIAGARRRELEDYGYWYAADGRSRDLQAEFERVEVKPQAIEWILSCACGVPFRVSADNLDAGSLPSAIFKQNVVDQARYYCQHGLPHRAHVLARAFFEAFQMKRSSAYKCVRESQNHSGLEKNNVLYEMHVSDVDLYCLHILDRFESHDTDQRRK